MKLPERYKEDFNYMLNIIKGLEITSIIQTIPNSIERLDIEIQEESDNWEEILIKIFTTGYGYKDDLNIFKALLATNKVDDYILRYMNLYGFSSTMVCEVTIEEGLLQYIKGTGFVINYDKEG